MNDFGWTGFYEAFADCLLKWNEDRHGLFQLIRKLGAQNPLFGYLHFEHAEMWSSRNDEIDPFTVMGIFNRGTTAEHRHELAALLARAVGLENLEPPSVFHGIPHLDPRKSIYDGNVEMWNLFLAAIRHENISADFEGAWDAAVAVRGNALGILSMGLFWARPYKFVPVDKISAPWIEAKFGLKEPADKCSGADYAAFNHELAHKLENARPKGSFPQMAFSAWQNVHGA